MLFGWRRRSASGFTVLTPANQRRLTPHSIQIFQFVIARKPAWSVSTSRTLFSASLPTAFELIQDSPSHCFVFASHSTRLSLIRVSLAGPDDVATRSPVRRLRSVFFWVSHRVVPSIRISDFDTPPAIKFGDLATIGWKVNVVPANS